MNIREQIEKIVEKRAAYLGPIDRSLKRLEEMRENIERVDYFKSQAIDKEGAIIPGGKYAGLLERNPEMAWKLQGVDSRSAREAIRTAEKILREKRVRFARKSVSISVVGEARRGKSTLLKSISGLDDYVIPAFESTDCTGAASIIYNREGDGLEARITFKSRQDMREMAQTYLDRLIPDPEKRIQLHTMEDIRNLDVDAITRERVPLGHPDSIVAPYLDKLARHYDQWQEYAGREDLMTLKDKSAIAEFVAQNNGVPVGQPGRKEYYKYLVVERCEIHCPFPTANLGNVNLIDTIGLGDHTEGILDKMLRTIAEESDAVIFMITPQNGAGGGLPQSVTGIYKEIAEKCGNRDLGKWLFYFLNEIVTPHGPYAANGQFVVSAKELLQRSNYFGWENAKIVDASNAQAVRDEFLIPLLQKLTEQLESVDAIHVTEMNATLKTVEVEYGLLCSAVGKVMRADFRNNASVIPLINRKTTESISHFRGELFQFLDRWRENRAQPCAIVYERSMEILDRLAMDPGDGDAFIPTRETLLDELNRGAPPQELYIYYENQIRNAVSEAFLNVNTVLGEYVNAFKDELSEIFYRNCGLMALLTPDETRPKREWLSNFSEGVLEDETQYPNIKLAVDTIVSFTFSVRGFLTFEVQNSLLSINPTFTDVPSVIGQDRSKTARRMWSSLKQCLIAVSDELREKIQTLAIKPNLAIFAELNECYDRIIYAEGVQEEWRNFYADKAGALWGEEIRRIQGLGVLCQDWLDIIEAMGKCNQAGYCRLL